MEEGGRLVRRAEPDNRADDRRVETAMRQAIALARGTRPHPNPRVGAVVLSSGGEVLARAAHLAPGEAHAEAAALAAAAERARGGTLVVTLEPCAHQGRTGPCTSVVIASGVSRVVIGAEDPDDLVSGRGIAELENAGIEVVVGTLAADVVALDPGYHHHRRIGTPRVTLKAAMTLDGQTAAADGTSRWITGAEARRDGHRLRAEADAVLIGAGTLRADDPRLDVRLAGFTGLQPRPIVVAGSRPLPSSAVLYGRDPLVYTPAPVGRDGIEQVVLAATGGVDLSGMMKDLGARGVVDLLVEGGATIAGALLAADLVDRIVVYMAATIAGGAGRGVFEGRFATLADATEVAVTEVTRLGPDLKIVADLHRGQPGEASP
jgi:diaminohydroxyphosphoribosylaminopyrimidine deaminase/5-amino-6-(5-phosphoribosylamino)uracil reductase